MLEPGVYGVPPGADFPAALAGGLGAWADMRPPEELARVTVFVNTRRMQRRIRALFDQGPPRLLPRIRLVTEIGRDLAAVDIPPAVPPLRRRLDLAALVARLIETAPDLAPPAAVFDLADSLAALMDEMQGEGVGIDAIRALDVTDASGHWARSQAFLSLVADYLAAGGAAPPDPQARLRLATLRLIERWQAAPPADPVIVAGSTGSRGTTALLMEAVARLPRGLLLLPGFDFDLPAAVWSGLAEPETGEDHPQFRFARLLDRLGIAPAAIRPWTGLAAPDPARNRLVSLSLRPAPVTDCWLREGPGLGDLRAATRGLTLIEADGPRDEAAAVAVVLRAAAERGRSAALVTPDRMLTRRVAALLDRWGIEPDDSAGRPLDLSPPGRLLRQAAALLHPGAAAADLLALLKHPLAHTDGDRGPHLRRTRELELFVRREGLPDLTPERLSAWGAEAPPEARDWVAWVAGLLPREGSGARPLQAHVDDLLALAARVCGGPGGTGAALWDKPAGRRAWEVMQELAREAGHGGITGAAEFEALLSSLLAAAEVRDRDAPHPGVMIWGTLEARVQGAELVVLGGLNEGTWPEAPTPDPWLNRRMRRAAGLLLPERRIGLSAHDYQQAVAAADVVLTRCRRDADAQPVPSRWLNRLLNLLGGLEGNHGPEALDAMRRRGAEWMRIAAALEHPPAPADPAPRPAPRPPVEARPKRLSVTGVETLLRDPYAIYARTILNLKRLDPLVPAPTAPLRGQILHAVFDRFMRDAALEPPADPAAQLVATAEEVLGRRVPWPMARRLWLARIARVADWFVAESAARPDQTFLTSEVRGRLDFPAFGFRLTATADRIDRIERTGAGRLAILDYKTGSAPTAASMAAFDKQLLLEALIAEAGGFDGVPATAVDHVAHIALGATPKWTEHRLEDSVDRQGRELNLSLPSVRAGMERLLARYAQRSTGYIARRAMHRVRFEGDYDHLARSGEWDDTQRSVPEDVG